MLSPVAWGLGFILHSSSKMVPYERYTHQDYKIENEAEFLLSKIPTLGPPWMSSFFTQSTEWRGHAHIPPEYLSEHPKWHVTSVASEPGLVFWHQDTFTNWATLGSWLPSPRATVSSYITKGLGCAFSLNKSMNGTQKNCFTTYTIPTNTVPLSKSRRG